ncbi:MAG TPA: SDR family NAD(P)-dependent oxidoreductase, partial [Firmicutes bacterium]|nr:SDR family NAD(P)-dependent oxidoreductase [Bacillota bacterium]
MMSGLKGKVVLLTGASAGIGAAIARAMAREGAHLIAAARRMERLTALKEELEGDWGVSVLPL